MKRTHSEVRAYYRDGGRARSYYKKRFTEPLGAILHDRQVTHVLRALESSGASSALEIAGGPARLTTEIAVGLDWEGVMIDASLPMLEVARNRLQNVQSDNWTFVCGDAFELPFRQQFDFVYTFRFVRHFEAEDRMKIYRQIRAVLRPGGRLVFDAVNSVVSGPIRLENEAEYPVFDALLSRETIEAELGEAGFGEVQFDDVQRRYRTLFRIQVLVAPRAPRIARLLMEIVDRMGGGEPLEWIVSCRRT